MLRLYDSRLSGNGWKVRILLNQLKQPFERVTLDLEAGEARTDRFLALNRFGRVPVLQLSDGRTVVESAAILLHLAENTEFLPADPYLKSQILGWLFFEQGDLQKFLAWPRIYFLRGLADQMSDEIRSLQQGGQVGLEKLEHWLNRNTWLVGDRYSIADLALFAYVSLAHEGGYQMKPYGSIARWLANVKAQPGWIDICERSPLENG